MKKIRTAIIGFGVSAQEFHASGIVNNENYELKKVLTNSPKNIKILKEEYPNVKLISEFVEACEDPNIDLIVIATPNDVHDEYTYKALMNNKHVVVEKPFVETYERAKELYKLAEEKNLVLKVFHNRKYDGDLNTLVNLMKTRDFGKLVSFTARFDRIRPSLGENWRFKDTHMAGIYYDLAPHLVHHAIALFGMPESVENNIYFDRENSLVDDHFEMILNYKDGFKAFIGAEMLQRDLVPKIKLIGTNKTYAKYDFDIPDSANYPYKEKYQVKKLKSELIDNDLKIEEIPVEIGKHYLYYETLANDIKNNVSINNPDTELALGVIKIMEKGIEANNKKKCIKL